jgi:hypothetical protein
VDGVNDLESGADTLWPIDIIDNNNSNIVNIFFIILF